MGLSQFAGTGFQVLFHSPPGVLFTFPSRYCFSIGHWVVFSLTEWSPLIPTGFHVPRGTLDTAGSLQDSRTRLSRSLAGLSRTFLLPSWIPWCSPNPMTQGHGLGSSAFARRYLRNRYYFLFLRLLRCFSSPGSLHTPMDSEHGDGYYPPGFPIQKSPDHCLFAAPRSFSQLTTSFIGSQCQGIRPALLFT